MSKLDDVFAYYGDAVDSQGWEVPELEHAKHKVKILVFDELIDALKDSKDLGESIDKFKEKVKNW